MKDLIKHIEYLLLDNDCVVIAGFGGFVTCHKTARYIDDENLFLPPIRTVGFNQDLTVDDGLLINSIMSTHNFTEEEANIYLSEQLLEFKQELSENGTYDMGSIGSFYTDEEDNMRFTPCMAGTVCPNFYGLDSVIFPKLSVSEDGNENSHTTIRKLSVEKNENEIVLRIKKSWISNIAAVAAVLIAFFLISPPVMNTGEYNNQEAKFTQIAWNGNYSNNAIHINKNAAEKTESHSKKDKENTEIKDISNNITESFCIVIASAIPETNAHNYVKQLKKNGYNNAAVYNNGKMIRVVLQGYSNREEAVKNLDILRKNSTEFSSAWILSI